MVLNMELDNLFQAQRQLSEKDLLIYHAELQKKNKSIELAYCLLIFFGGLGLHKFYLGKVVEGIAYLLVCTTDFILLRVIIFNTDKFWEPTAIIYILFGVPAIFLLSDLFTLPKQVSQQEKQLRIDLLKQFGIVVKDVDVAKKYRAIRDDIFINNNFIHNEDGTVIHKSTGLMWQIFSVGQTWDRGICVGDPIKMSWDDAMKLTSNHAGYGDWRLPTKEELTTLVSTNTNKKDRLYWSSSLFAINNSDAWTVSLYNGVSYYDYKNSSNFVRLVR